MCRLSVLPLGLHIAILRQRLVRFNSNSMNMKAETAIQPWYSVACLQQDRIQLAHFCVEQITLAIGSI